MFNDIINALNPIYFLLSVAIFLSGIYLGPEVVNRNIRWLLAYPLWMKRLMENYFQRSRGFLIIFITIFVLNNFSLFCFRFFDCFTAPGSFSNRSKCVDYQLRADGMERGLAYPDESGCLVRISGCLDLLYTLLPTGTCPVDAP